MSVETKAREEDGHSVWETVKIILQALAIAFVVRIFLFQPFNIPSGSMKDTLLVGDFLFVAKYAYGYSKHSFTRFVTLCVPFTDSCITIRILPDFISSGRVWSAMPERGDVVVFKLPSDNSTDYIKRVIGLPGDRVQMRSGVLYLNGTAIPKERAEDAFVACFDGQAKRRVDRFKETLPTGVSYYTLDCRQNADADTTQEFLVPPDHYFMMGDNRDNSIDSRFTPSGPGEPGVGFVPHENLIGRATLIWYSCASDEPGRCSYVTPWTWPFDIRWSRIFHFVH